MSENTILSSSEDSRHCFADISIDSDQLWRWQNRDKLRSQDAPTLLPVIDPNVLPKWLRSCVGYEKSLAASEFLREILRHWTPAAFVGASSAQHNATTMRGANAIGHTSLPREKTVSGRYAVVPKLEMTEPMFQKNTTGARA